MPRITHVLSPYLQAHYAKYCLLVILSGVQPLSVPFAHSNDTVQFRFHDAPLGVIIEQLNQNLVKEYRLADELASQPASIELDPLPARQALEAIKQRFDLIEKPAENFILLVKHPQNVPIPKTPVQKQVLSHPPQNTRLNVVLPEQRTVRVYQPKHTNAKSFEPLLSHTLGGILQQKSLVRTNPSNNLLVVKATEDEHLEITLLLASIDQPASVVRVYSRILIARKQAQQELGKRMGINLQSGSYGFIAGVNQSVNNQGINGNLAVDFGVIGAGSAALLSYSSGNDTLSLEIQALESSGLVDVVATPQVLVNSGETAYIATGSQVPYVINNGDDGSDVEFKDAVLSLKVTPNVESQQRIALNIEFSMDSVGALYANFPSIETNKLSTIVTMQTGQTLVLGGVFLQTASKVEAKTPFLSALPIIGSLFRYSANSVEEAELIVFLTPVLETSPQ